jgi:hypothetical protein
LLLEIKIAVNLSGSVHLCISLSACFALDGSIELFSIYQQKE